jgi:hypothetical protein
MAKRAHFTAIISAPKSRIPETETDIGGHSLECYTFIVAPRLDDFLAILCVPMPGEGVPNGVLFNHG